MPVNLERINATILRTNRLITENKKCIDNNIRSLYWDIGILSAWATAFTVGSLAYLTENKLEASILSFSTQVGALVTTSVCVARISKVWLLKEGNINLDQERLLLEDMYNIGQEINKYPSLYKDNNGVVYIPHLPQFATIFDN